MNNWLQRRIAKFRTPKRTVTCVDCAHHMVITVDPDSNPSIWYNNFCSASPRAKAIDPVTGKHGYASCNDFGTQIIIGEPYEYCRDINKDGHCSLFQEMEVNDE